MPKLVRALRLSLMLAAVSISLGSPLYVAAEDNDHVIMAAAATTLSVDSPAPNTLVTNGEGVLIGGWTTGSRVDVYLNGPAGRGQGIDSMPSNAGRRGDANGFEVAWYPVDLGPGSHTLYVYSLVDGAWTVQMVPVMATGNFIDPDKGARGRDDGPIVSEATTD